MKNSPILAGLFMVTPAMADNSYWTPDAATVQKLDSALVEPSASSGAPPAIGHFSCPTPDKTQLARHYWGIIDKNGHHIIKVELRVLKYWPAETAGIHIESSPYNSVTDGGCSRASASWDLQTSKLLVAHIFADWGGR